MKTCCCTGHRPKGFTFAYGVDTEKHSKYLKMLSETLRRAVTEYGVVRFITGMAIGVDTDFAEAVLELKKEYPVTLECAVPCPNQTLKWNEKDKLRYDRILERADKVITVSDRYTPECMLKRNRYMVDESDILIAVFNGKQAGGTFYTIRYAEQKKKPILMIDLREI